jgi:hypothetical protein
MMDPLVKRNRWLLVSGLSELTYGLGEFGDTMYLLFLQGHLLPNYYPVWSFAELNHLMSASPAILSPVFAFFAVGRLVAAMGVLRNRLWGFWLSLFLSLVTASWAVFFLPLGGIDMIACLLIVCALLVGRFGHKTILFERSST